VADMQGYDVVFVGNDILWTSSAIDKITSATTWPTISTPGAKCWPPALSGATTTGAWRRPLPERRLFAFEIATTDYWDPVALGAFDAGHPIMAASPPSPKL